MTDQAVTSVTVLADYRLLLSFANGDQRYSTSNRIWTKGSSPP